MNNFLPDNERALWLLKTKGEQPLNVLAEEMKVTTEGARFQLLKLANEGLVESKTVAKGRGRPQQIWFLSTLGQARFPDTHAELTVRLIQKIRETLGNGAIDAIVEANGKEDIVRYQKEMLDIPDVESRIKKLTEIRSRAGYMAEYVKNENGFTFIENHCPICAAASACQGFCKMELKTFQNVLGKKVKIERTDHILAGARRCAYKITILNL